MELVCLGLGEKVKKSQASQSGPDLEFWSISRSVRPVIRVIPDPFPSDSETENRLKTKTNGINPPKTLASHFALLNGQQFKSSLASVNQSQSVTRRRHSFSGRALLVDMETWVAILHKKCLRR
ncbi:hypothetical protein F0562_002576 [Nyssa sinensis]|uniref:Uncharacterized protein n=1 Tax=Nyssa sinensis TaxID=561372 RepID=A0A5J5C9W9_9ASTE|nr:hypothetical protein F0562_002576 [Nyssa sinensis]